MWAAIALAKKNIPLDTKIIGKGCEVTVTKGVKHEYAVWDETGVYDCPGEYIGEILKRIDNDLLITK